MMLSENPEIEGIDENAAAPVEAEAEDQETEQPEAQEQPEPASEEQRTVPYQALAEERKKRQQEAQRNAMLAERLDQLAARLSEPSSSSQPNQDTPAKPNWDEDFAGAMRGTLEELASWKRSQEQQTAQQAQQAQQERQLQSLLQRANSEAQQYAKSNPDYPDAYNFYRESRANELEVLGYTGQQAQQLINREELQFLHRAQQAGLSAPEMIHNLAQRRGFTASRVESSAPPAKKPAPKSVSAMSGRPTTGKLTADKLLAMPEAEYHALMKQDPAKIRAIMRGAA